MTDYTKTEGGELALKTLVEMFFQQFITVSHFLCPIPLLDTCKRQNFDTFLLHCLEKSLEKFHKQEDADMKKKDSCAE